MLTINPKSSEFNLDETEGRVNASPYFSSKRLSHTLIVHERFNSIPSLPVPGCTDYTPNHDFVLKK
jgi:hypothetical protein